MQVPNIRNILLDEEKAKQFFKYSVVFAAGSITTGIMGYLEQKKFTNKLKARNEVIKKYREEIKRIQNDVTLSGEERDERIETIVKFVDLVLDQPL